MPAASRRDRIASELIRLLAKKRVELGLSKNALATKAGLSIGAIRFIEDGKRKPSLDTVLRICEGLGVELWEVLRETGK